MQNNDKKIGLVVPNIDSGWAQNVWPAFVRTALAGKKSLFIFPGGRLGSPEDSEYLRNSVYSLVNRENLDGLIGWSSSIRYTQSDAEFERFHGGFGSLPFVTLACKIPGHPSVDFDSYTGMKMLILHRIRLHGAKKIAFLRGPDNNPAAAARFRGYRDALVESGLPFFADSPLVSDPMNWSNGAGAAKQLHDRKLTPGEDFDTLVGSNDLMALDAIKYFAKLGFRIPANYYALGFDNSVESRLADSPLSTVHVPYEALSRESFRLVSLLIDEGKSCFGGDGKNDDFYLPTEPIIRESCGCGAAHFLPAGPAEQTGKLNIHSAKEREEALTLMIATYLKVKADDIGALVTPMVNFLFSIFEQNSSDEVSRSSTRVFFDLFEKALHRFYDSNRDTELLFGLIEGISRSRLVAPELMKRIEPVFYRTIYKVREQYIYKARYEREKSDAVRLSLVCALIGVRDMASLVEILSRYLPKMGIDTAGIALRVNDASSLWAGGFSPDGTVHAGDEVFPAKLLVPESLRDSFSRGIFMVQPLFTENRALGYFIHSASVREGIVYEELRSAVCYALKAVYAHDTRA